MRANESKSKLFFSLSEEIKKTPNNLVEAGKMSDVKSEGPCQVRT